MEGFHKDSHIYTMFGSTKTQSRNQNLIIDYISNIIVPTCDNK